MKRFSLVQNPLWFSLFALVSVDSVTSEADKSLEFLIIGDWGKGGNSGNILDTMSSTSGQTQLRYPQVKYERDDSYSVSGHNKEDGKKHKHYTYQAAIARAMSTWANHSEVTPSFVVAVGDNFYDDGVSSVTDASWNTLWVDVYLANYTNLRIPWYPVLGNHDYGYGLSGAFAEVNRYKSVSSNDISAGLWRFKGFNYSETFNTPDGGTIAMIFVDTTTLAPSENNCCNENGGVTVEMQASRISNQVTHIRRMLQEAQQSNPTWLVMAGHYPVYSSGEHGDIQELLTYLLPLIREFNVDAYIAGHDHISQHLRADGTEYFISGAGAMTDVLGGTPSAASVLWSGTGYSAFCAVRASSSILNVSFVHWNGSVMYSHVMTKIVNKSSDNGDDYSPGDSVVEKGRSTSSSFKIGLDDMLPYVIPACGVASILLALLIVLFAFTGSKKKLHQRTSSTKEQTTVSTTSTGSSDEPLARPRTRRRTKRHGGPGTRVAYTHVQNDPYSDGSDGDTAVDPDEDILSKQEQGMSVNTSPNNIGDDIISRALHPMPTAGLVGGGGSTGAHWGRLGGTTGILYTRDDSVKKRGDAHRKVRSSA